MPDVNHEKMLVHRVKLVIFEQKVDCNQFANNTIPAKAREQFVDLQVYRIKLCITGCITFVPMYTSHSQVRPAVILSCDCGPLASIPHSLLVAQLMELPHSKTHRES